MKKIIVFIVSVVFILLFFYLFFPDFLQYMTLENIQASHDKWMGIYAAHPFRIISYFLIFNIFMAMLPVPGISMISFLGGSLFGFFPGLLMSSVATAIGNLGGFFLGRYFVHGWVKSNYGNQLIVFREQWQQDGAFALLSFRLFPLIPSFVANFVMGVTALHWWTFFWVSWVGRIPMVVVYAWSGAQFLKIQSFEEILSVKILILFVILAILPWILKFILEKIKKEHR
jgi:uncharacterized membrane protein YdjX (TVP38/TMEM64 family)